MDLSTIEQVVLIGSRLLAVFVAVTTLNDRWRRHRPRAPAQPAEAVSRAGRRELGT